MTSTYDLMNTVNDDDINVAPPDQYVDGGMTLIPESTYHVRLLDFEPEFDESGTFRKSIHLKSVQVVGVREEGLVPYLGRKVNNLRVWTTTFQRNGVTVSGLGDLLRGITLDQWSGLKGATDILQEAVDKQTPIEIRFVWGAFDKLGYEQAGGKQMEKGSQAEKELRKRCTVKGMRNFKQLPDGAYFPEVVGPVSGQTLEGRLEIGGVTSCAKKREMIVER